MLSPKVEEQLEKMEKYTGKINGLPTEGDQLENGWGELGVYRVMFAVATFHALFSLIMIKVNSSRDPRAGLQNGWWFIKLLLLIGGMVGAFFIPNSFFIVWGWIGLVCAFFFIIIQMALLVDFAHSWNESWVAKAEEGQKCFKFALLAVCIGLFLSAIVVTILLYVFYTQADGENCGLSKFFISFNLIVGIVTTVASIHPRVQERIPTSGLLQAGVVFFYGTYLTWSAVSGVPSSCGGAGSSTGATVVGAMMTFLSVAYASLRTSSSSQLGKLGIGDAESKVLLDEESGEVDCDKCEENNRMNVVDSRTASSTAGSSFTSPSCSLHFTSWRFLLIGPPSRMALMHPLLLVVGCLPCGLRSSPLGSPMPSTCGLW